MLAKVGHLTAQLTYFAYHAPDKFPAFDDLAGKKQGTAPREQSESEVRDEALSVIATLIAMNKVAERRQRKA